jgi:hypothetical protein
MTPSHWQDALAYLTNTDEIIAGLIVSYPNAVLKNQGNPFLLSPRQEKSRISAATIP